MGYLLLWPEEGLNSLSSNLKLPVPDGLSFFRVVAAARLATLRNCVIHRYASSQGQASGFLKLQNLLARELVEQLAKRMISYLMMDLFIDPTCVADETLDKGAW